MKFDIQFDTWKDNDGICLDDLEKNNQKQKNIRTNPIMKKKNGMIWIKCNSFFIFFSFRVSYYNYFHLLLAHLYLLFTSFFFSLPFNLYFTII